MIQELEKQVAGAANMADVEAIILGEAGNYYANRFANEVRKFDRTKETQDQWLLAVEEKFGEDLRKTRLHLLTKVPNRLRNSAIWTKLTNFLYVKDPNDKGPKYPNGTVVSLKKKTLYNELAGTITDFTRVYLEVDENGNFERRGLATMEDTIASIQIPYSFDGATLEVHYPESKFTNFTQPARTRRAKFYGYAYTIKTDKMLSVYSESQVKPIL